MPYLQEIHLLKDRIPNHEVFPFSIPTLRNFSHLTLKSNICFFVGENGTGKSTLLEAIALYSGYALEGGSKHMRYSTLEVEHQEPLHLLAKALSLSWKKKLLNGYFFRAESFFATATYLENIDPSLQDYGGKSLHRQSHGESFLSIFKNRFSSGGFYLFDEPEAALSPQRQLSLLVLIHELLQKPDCQFIVATHSPILLAYPGAQIFSFDTEYITEITYEETGAYQVMKNFLDNPSLYLQHLFGE